MSAPRVCAITATHTSWSERSAYSGWGRRNLVTIRLDDDGTVPALSDGYATYQSKTEGEIPVVLLEPLDIGST